MDMLGSRRGRDARGVRGPVSKGRVGGVSESGDDGVAVPIDGDADKGIVVDREVADRTATSDQESDGRSRVERKTVESLGDEDRRTGSGDGDAVLDRLDVCLGEHGSTSATASSPPDGATSPTIRIAGGQTSSPFGRGRSSSSPINDCWPSVSRNSLI